jgi:hypothetical protein
MAISQHLRRNLQEALGAEAAADLVSQIEDMTTLRGDLNELRHEMRLGFARVDARFANLEKTIEGLSDLARTTDKRIGDLERLIEKRTGDVMKWSFAFWIGAVGAIAALAGVLR